MHVVREGGAEVRLESNGGKQFSVISLRTRSAMLVRWRGGSAIPLIALLFAPSFPCSNFSHASSASRNDKC